LYSSFIYRLKLGFKRLFRRGCNWFWNVLLRKDTQVWANEVLMIIELQASRSIGDARIWSIYSSHSGLTQNCWACGRG
jgi:hypothetical protein